jgi:predicted ATPase
MITQFGFNNFKAWEKFGPVPFAPLTVLFGSNSSGKSSVAQVLLMLKQTVESQDKKMVFNIGSTKTAVDLGNFYELVFEHEESRKIGLTLTWTLPKALELRDRHGNRDYSGEKVRFDAEVGLAGKNPVLGVYHMKYALGDAKGKGMEVGMRRTDKPKPPFELTSRNYNFVRNPGRVWPITAPTKCYGFPDEVVNYYQNADVVKALGFTFEKLFQNLFYLGPLRERFIRQYTWTGEAPEHVGWKGEQTIPAILAGHERQLNGGKKKKNRRFAEMVAHLLKQMGLIEAFDVKQVAPKRREYEVLVKTRGADRWVNITDVGFGISQFLPVLVQCFYAPPGSIIIIEQPEIHLHPSAQTWLADLFIEVIRSGENGATRGIQLVIESHSEHFLRRLQRRIAEKVVARNEVAAYFCEPGLKGSSLISLDVDLFGNIRNWPDKFFGDTMGDAVAMTEAQMERMRNGEKPHE